MAQTKKQTEDFAVPRSRIPQLAAVCPTCEGGTRTVLSQAFTDGYHRRHNCPTCVTYFYTLTPYNGQTGETHQSDTAFQDRPMGEIEMLERIEWWRQDAAMAVITSPGNVEVDKPPIIWRIMLALVKKEHERDQVDRLLVTAMKAIEEKLERLEHDINKREENGQGDGESTGGGG